MSTDLVTAAGGAAARVAGVVSGLDLAAPVRGLGAALPGGRTAAAAGQAGEAWVATVAEVAGQMRRHADALTACAQAYLDAERAAAVLAPSTPTVPAPAYDGPPPGSS